jgi:hypothetical protein
MKIIITPLIILVYEGKSQFIVRSKNVHQALRLLTKIRLFWANEPFGLCLICMNFAKPLKRQRIYLAVCEIILLRERVTKAEIHLKVGKGIVCQNRY